MGQLDYIYYTIVIGFLILVGNLVMCIKYFKIFKPFVKLISLLVKKKKKHTHTVKNIYSFGFRKRVEAIYSKTVIKNVLKIILKKSSGILRGATPRENKSYLKINLSMFRVVLTKIIKIPLKSK